MLKSNNKNYVKISTGFLALLLVMPFFSGCKDKPVQYSVDLEIWGVFDDTEDYSQIISEYKKVNPFIGNISYKKFTVDNYKKDLLNALASGNGPDIFMVNNFWMPRFEDKVAPAPTRIINEQLFRDNFIDVVTNDFLGGAGEIYGVPLSVDSLALYYNKDLFNAAGIASPPTTWEELVEDSKKMTKVDDIGTISHSGVALGTSRNINRSPDIIEFLLFQHGARLPSKNNPAFSVDYNMGTDVLEFYTQFARSSSPAYSWNRVKHYSIDSFYEGNLAMMFNYSWHIETLRSKNAKLNFAVAPAPQLSKNSPSNYANYWSFVVNRSKEVKRQENAVSLNNEERIHEAWQFLKYLTFKNNGTFKTISAKSGNEKEFSLAVDPADIYLKETSKPAARKDLIEKQKTDPVLGAFAYGNLIAKTWYRKDADAVENIWAELITALNKGDMTAGEAFNLAKTRINKVNQ